MVKLYSRILEIFSSNLYLDFRFLHRSCASFSPAPAVKQRDTDRSSANTDILQTTISLTNYESQYGEGHKMNQKMILHKQQTSFTCENEEDCKITVWTQIYVGIIDYSKY